MLSTIKIATRNLTSFSFFGANKGDNATATLKDINNLVTQLNDMMPYRMYDIAIDQTAAENLRIKALAAGASECSHSCSGDCFTCDCRSNCTNEGVSYSNGVILPPPIVGVHTGVGVYRVTITLPESYLVQQRRAMQDVGFFFTPFSNIAHEVTVTKVAGNVYDLRTYNAGVLSDGIFVNTIVSLRMYF